MAKNVLQALRRLHNMQKAYVKWFSQSVPALHCLLGNKRLMVVLTGATVLQMYVGSCCVFDLDHGKQSTLEDKIYGFSSGDETRPRRMCWIPERYSTF